MYNHFSGFNYITTSWSHCFKACMLQTDRSENAATVVSQIAVEVIGLVIVVADRC